MFPLVTVLVVCFNMVNFGKLAEWQGSGLLTRHSEMGALVRSQYFPPSYNVAPSVMVAHLSVKQVERVRFPGSTQVLVGVMVAQGTPNALAGVRFSHGMPVLKSFKAKVKN